MIIRYFQARLYFDFRKYMTLKLNYLKEISQKYNLDFNKDEFKRFEQLDIRGNRNQPCLNAK